MKKLKKKSLVGWTYKGWEKDLGMIKEVLRGRLRCGEKTYEELGIDYPFLYPYKRDLMDVMRCDDPSLFKKVRITIEEIK